MRSLLIVLTLFATCVFSPALAAPATIVVLGDSLSAGYGIAQSEAWPSLLQQRLRQQGANYSVVNHSISGETTAGGRSRLAAALQKDKPQILIIALGANDGLRGLPLTQMQDNLRAMIRAGRQSGARVLLVGMRLPPNYGPYAEDFFQRFARLADSEKTAYLPFLLEPLNTRPELFQNDRLHPNAAAQPLLLDHIWPALRPLLKK